MKHRHIGIEHVKLISGGGHAIGLDIGATGIRAAVLAPGTVGGRPSVTPQGFGSVALPEGAVANGAVIEPAIVTTALRNMWREHKFDSRNVILGITHPQITVREVTMPDLPPAQLRAALPFQAKDIVALPLDQAVLDFTPLGRTGPDDDLLDGLLIAAPREPISVAVNAVEAAGLKVARVDLASFATLRACADVDLRTGAVVDLGSHVTNVVIHSDGVPRLVRSVMRGGQELTDKLAQRQDVPRDEAEWLKCTVGLTGDDAGVTEALLEYVRPLFGEIRSSIHLFGTMHGGLVPERIALTGGGSALLGLPEALQKIVGIPVAVSDALHHVNNRYTRRGGGEVDARAATAVSVGLAMGAAA